MKTVRHRSTFVVVIAMVMSALGMLGATAAHAMCPSDSGWEVTGRADFWLLSGTTSSWMAGPGTISWNKSTSDTRGTTQDLHIGASVSYIIARAEAKYSATWTSSTTKTNSWTYSISVPAGQTARLAVYRRGSRFSVQKWTDNPNCTTTWGSVYYQFSPGTSSGIDSFCIAKDPYPGTTYVSNNNGCGH